MLLTNGEYEVVGEKYINSLTPIEMVHKLCGHLFAPSASNFLLSGSKCPKCYGNIKLDIDTFKERVKDQVGEEYTVIGDEYVDIHTKIEIRHNVCGFTNPTDPNNFLNNGTRCLKCSGLMKLDIETFIERVRNEVGNEYTVVGDEYINNHTPIEIKHNICGYIYPVNPSSFLNAGNRCPQCDESRGERKIRTFLDAVSIKYIPQYKFIDCKFKKPLPFDFALFDEENNLISLIEYDGIQHEMPIDFFGGEKGYLSTKNSDNIKNKYCESNELNLLRISYHEFSNIENIILKEIEGIK